MQSSLRPDTLAALIRVALIPTALLLAAAPAAATIYTVNTTSDTASGSGTSGSLRYAINQAGNGDTIQFSCAAIGCPVTLPVQLKGNNGGFPGPTAYSIKGKSITIVAPNPGDVTLQAQPAGNTTGTSLRLFFVDSDAGLTLQNVDLRDGRAIGGNGGAAYHGAGGGAAGLGGAIFSQGNLSLVGVSFLGNGAVGGSSAINPNAGVEFGGGGGLGGDGGAAPSGGGGGTGGPGGLPYQSGNVRYSGRGGSGLGGLGGGTPGGRDFVHPHLNFYPPGVASNGGGGGGGYINNAAHGSEGGGGGSGGSAYLSLPAGGNGGFGGGGGGNRGTNGGYCLTVAGNGGFGGGGGSGCGTATNGAIGRRGGVGGGTGSGYVPGGAAAGGGAAFGGAVFARSGSVTVRNPGPAAGISGNNVTGGTGANNGAAVGRALFLMSGVPTTFDIAGGYTIAQDIADDSASSVSNGQGYTPGNGAGATVIKSGTGTLRLDGNNTYAGLTTVAAGTLAGTGGVVGPVRLQGGATVAPGAASTVGGFETGPFTWDGGGTVRLRLGANTAASDQLLVNGALSKGTAGTYAFRFDSGGATPPPGQVYTLIESSNAAAFSPGDFSYTVAPGSEGLGGVFSVVGNAVRFTVQGSNQSITFPAQPARTYSPGGSFPISPPATASSGLAVTYGSSTTAVCTVTGTTVSIVTAGDCTLTANQAGDATWQPAAPQTQTVVIARAAQTVTFSSLPPRTYSPGASFPLNATASSGLGAEFASNTPAACTVTGSTVTIVASGTCSITASQAGNVNWLAAAPQTQTFNIDRASQVLTFPTQTWARREFILGQTFAITPLATSAAPNSNQPITYSSLSSNICTVSGTTVTMAALGTCVIAANQAGDANHNAAAQATTQVVLEVYAEAQLQMFKDADNDTATVGETVTYTISAVNRGPADAVDVRVRDVPPARLGSVVWTCSEAGEGAACPTPATGTGSLDAVLDMPRSGYVQFRLSGTVLPAAASGNNAVIVNTATVQLPQGSPLTDPVPGDNQSTAEVTVLTPLDPNATDLLVLKTTPTRVARVGDVVAYTIIAGNQGPLAALGVKLRDVPPARLGNVTWQCMQAAGGAACPAVSTGQGSIDATLDLPASGVVLYQLVGTLLPSPSAGAGALVSNTATIALAAGAPPTDPDLASNTSTASVMVLTADAVQVDGFEGEPQP